MIRCVASSDGLYHGHMSPLELFHEARLTEAVAAQSDVVADRPDDIAERLLLCDLLAFTGDREAVRRHLNSIKDAPADVIDYVAEWLDLLRADDARHAGTRPEFVIEPPAHLLRRLDAIDALCAGNEERALDLLDDADEMAGGVEGHVDGRPFEGWRDSDDLLGPTLEFFRDGRHFWVAHDQVRKLRLDDCESLRDQLYRPATLWLANGEVLEVFVPFLYVGTALHPEEGIRTGAGIDWEERNGLMRGLGSRTLLLGEEELTLAEFRQIETR